MKQSFLLAFTLLLTQLLQAQFKDYKVVFDLTSRDTIDQQNVLRWVREISTAVPDAQLEVVLYGKSLDMVRSDRSTVRDAVTQLAGKNNVAFRVCAVAMKNQQVDKSMLLPGVQTVPDGIYELISKQREGWGYIKVAH